jgi:hypothetical protein
MASYSARPTSSFGISVATISRLLAPGTSLLLQGSCHTLSRVHLRAAKVLKYLNETLHKANMKIHYQ